MADAIVKLAEFQTLRKNFSILNFTAVRLREHERDGFLIGKMGSFKKVPPFAYRLIIAVASFSTAEYGFSQAERVRDINATGRPSYDNTAASAKSEASVSTSKGTPS